MRLSLIGVTAAVAIAMPAIAVAGAPGVPAAADTRANLPASPTLIQGLATPAVPHHFTAVQYYIDLNSATRKELMTLPGVGAAEAGRIIANRPYLTKTELVTKNVMPVGPYLSVRDLVVAMPKTGAKGKH
jgi:hypothetical protein